MSEDKKTAIFKMDGVAEEYKNIVAQRLKEATYEDGFEFPQHTIQICSDLTDGPIPSLSINYDSFELSCDWKEMYTIFWSEVQMTSNITGDWVKNQESWMMGLKAEVQSGQLNIESMMMQALNGFASSNQDAGKTARRRRIKILTKRKYPEMDDYELDEDEEKGILKALNEKRRIYSTLMMHDEEDDDEQDDSDEDGESAEDEWVDEDEEEESNSMDGHSHAHQ